MTSESGRRTNSATAAAHFGVRGRLLLAFFAIAAFSVLAAAVGIYAFREVGSRLDIVDTRIPSTVSALELSRSAERIIATAPALLAANDRNQSDEASVALASEVQRLKASLAQVKEEDAGVLPATSIEPVVAELLSNLAALEDVVTRRLEMSERIKLLQDRVFQANDETQRLLQPWLDVLHGQIEILIEAEGDGFSDGVDQSDDLPSIIDLQEKTRTAQAKVSTVADMLVEASTADQAERLPVLAFQLDSELDGLEATAAGFDTRLRPMFLEQVKALRDLSEGPDAIVETRKQELSLIDESEHLLVSAGQLSARLTAAVDELGAAAKQDIGASISDALSVQRLGTRTLIAVALLSLLASGLIVWLYVGRNVVRRLTALSDSVRAIAGGSARAPVSAEGKDEIAAMGRAVEVLRRNTLERDDLLAEKAQAAERLEAEVQQRTHELSEFLRQQTATADVLKVISRSSFDLRSVLNTLVEAAARLCEADGAAMARERGGVQYQVAYYGTPAGYEEFIRDIPLAPGRGSLVGRVLLTRAPVQIVDAQADEEFTMHEVREFIGFRTLLGVPLLREGHPIGVFVIWRRSVQPFNPRQIELLATFADQGVIAIENTRLFDDIQDKSRQLEIADKYKSHFLASASHDLRQPLHALNLFVAQLRQESDTRERERLVGRIDAAAASMSELFESLLDMSKLEAGIIEPHLTAFPVERALSRIENTFTGTAREKGLRLTVVPCTASVRSDFVLLERILMNLVSNAIRYTAHGGIVVGCRRRGDRLRIDICDSGPGIPDEQQGRVFGEYYRIASEPGGGFGLGLAIVERLGQLLGHEIDLVSRPGHGSRFSVSVPRAIEPYVASETSALADTVDPLRGKLVLVIDDDPLALEGTAGILRRWGCEVLTADSEEGLLPMVAARKLHPDLIVSDYRLANGKTGIAAIEHLRNELVAAIPGVLVSGDTAPETLRHAQESGFHLLHKPVAPMRLRALLGQLLGKSAARPTAAE